MTMLKEIMLKKSFFISLLLNCIFCLYPNIIYAGPDNKTEEIEIEIINHKFSPEILEVPAGKKIRLTIINRDDTIEEFESIDLKREKIIPANTSARVVLAPLSPGEYKFFGEFHPDSAVGKIIAKPENPQ